MGDEWDGVIGATHMGILDGPKQKSKWHILPLKNGKEGTEHVALVKNFLLNGCKGRVLITSLRGSHKFRGC